MRMVDLVINKTAIIIVTIIIIIMVLDNNG